MTVSVASNAGFCFGVRRATECVEKMIVEKDGKDIVCTLGKLIHNDQYVDYLSKNGVFDIGENDIDALLEKAENGHRVTVIIRTHGIEKPIQKRLESYSEECKNFSVVDCTCPYVKKIHKIASENSQNNETLILIGQKNHPEVLSIVSYINGENGYVFSGAEELEEFLKKSKNDKNPICMVAQTTQKLSEWKKCQEILKKYCTNAKIFDTICRVTEQRQTEAELMCKKSDVMLVIGGKESSNTSKLYQICLSYCPKTFWIQTKDDIPFEKIGKANEIGITAGASTPDSLIQEVKKSMSEKFTEESFAELLEEQFASETRQKIYKGAVVKGKVTGVSEKEVQLDLGAKCTGIISRDKITKDNDAKLTEMFRLGEEIEAKVETTSDADGIITLSKKAVDDVKNWGKIVEYCENGTIVDAKIIKATKGGLVSLVEGAEVFIPASMTGTGKEEDLAKFVGKTEKIKIAEIKADRKKAIGSIKAVIREEKKQAEEKFWAGLEEGKEYEGPVKSITSYGAFVDLGGVDGLVHITELSWKRIKNPTEVVNVGDTIKVFVKSFDKEAKKISLGYRTEEENPWNIFKSKYAEGDIADVKVVGVTTFGAFAEVVPGVDGLIHISQIADQKIDSVANMLKVGDTVQAKIVGIDDEKHKVSLSIRALLPESTEETAVEEDTAKATEETAE